MAAIDLIDALFENATVDDIKTYFVERTHEDRFKEIAQETFFERHGARVPRSELTHHAVWYGYELAVNSQYLAGNGRQ